MKTTKEDRIEIRMLGQGCGPAVASILCDDADEAERLEAEVAKLRKRLEAFETCVKRLYHDAID